MPDLGCLFEKKFWKFLEFLQELESPCDLEEELDHLRMDQHDFERYRRFFEYCSVKLHYDQKYIYPLPAIKELKLQMTFEEWLKKRSLFVNLKEEDHKIKQDFDENIVKRTDYCMRHKMSAKFVFEDKKMKDVFAHRIVYIDGELCVVGETCEDRSLCYLNIAEISEIKPNVSESYSPNFSQLEVNEFINAVRLINGKEERIVLKMYGVDESEMNPDYHFLGNPYVTTNMENDFIWAASIEVCTPLYEWLFSMRDRVEVLDPVYVKKEFSFFCEQKKLKKAS